MNEILKNIVIASASLGGAMLIAILISGNNFIKEISLKDFVIIFLPYLIIYLLIMHFKKKVDW